MLKTLIKRPSAALTNMTVAFAGQKLMNMRKTHELNEQRSPVTAASTHEMI